VAVLAVALALSATACSAEPQAERDDTGAVATEGAVDAFSVALGDCLNEAPAGTSEGDVEEVDSVQGDAVRPAAHG
jgi:hypothetical protein